MSRLITTEIQFSQTQELKRQAKPEIATKNRSVKGGCFILSLTTLVSGCSIVHLPPSHTQPNDAIADTKSAPIAISPIEDSPAASSSSLPLIRNLFFETDSLELTLESEVLFDSIIQELDKYSFTQIKVIGHTDTVATQPYNHTLSNLRAEHITQELIRHGVDPGDIITEGRGEGELLVPTDDNVSDVRNRRVTVEFR